MITVGRLRRMNTDLANQCTRTQADSDEITYTMFVAVDPKIKPVLPQKNKAWCHPYFWTEIAYTRRIRSKNKLLSKSFVTVTENIFPPEVLNV